MHRSVLPGPRARDVHWRPGARRAVERTTSCRCARPARRRRGQQPCVDRERPDVGGVRRGSHAHRDRRGERVVPGEAPIVPMSIRSWRRPAGSWAQPLRAWRAPGLTWRSGPLLRAMPCLPAMFRAAALLVLFLALVQGTGLGAVLDNPACAAEHHQSDRPNECPPDCAACWCCSHGTPVPLPIMGAITEPAPAAHPFDEPGSSRRPSPDPRGILHVPLAAV